MLTSDSSFSCSKRVVCGSNRSCLSKIGFKNNKHIATDSLALCCKIYGDRSATSTDVFAKYSATRLYKSSPQELYQRVLPFSIFFLFSVLIESPCEVSYQTSGTCDALTNND